MDGRVLIVGAGGLGSPAALYLAAAGVRTIGLVDFDVVDESNLQRQVIYETSDIGQPKLSAAARHLRAINPGLRLELHDTRFTAENGCELAGGYDVVIDGTDNFPARYLVNDACVLTRRPNVYGSILRFEGQAAVFAASGGPCYRCLHPEPPPSGLIPSCAEGGVLGVLPGVIGAIQAAEAIKLLDRSGTALVGRMLIYDALRMRFRQIALPRDPDCPVCGDRPVIRTLQAYDQACDADLSTRSHASADDLTVQQLQEWRADRKAHLLVDVREPFEHEARRIDGAVLIPLGALTGCLDRLPRDRPVVVHCQTGARSARAAAMLRAAGFDARNLSGGIQAWNP